MVYVSGGKYEESSPWSLQRLIGFLWGIIAFIIFFFKTLTGLEDGSRGGSGSRNGRGGSGPGNGPGGGPRRIGRITEINDSSMPGGGCG